MRVAAILGKNPSPKVVRSFQNLPETEWCVGCPASADGTDAILIFGGDGTVHRYLPALVQLQLPLLVVPCGSGNDFARALGLKNKKHALGAWRRFLAEDSAVRLIDLLIVRELATDEQHYVCCAGGVGLDAVVARYANGLPSWLRARGGYALSMLPAWFHYQPAPMKVIPAENISGLGGNGPRLLAAIFANAPAYGGGMKIAPKAQIDDGKLDVCVISEMPGLDFLKAFPRVYSGQHLRNRHVEYLQTQGLKIETEFPMDVYGDGEYLCKTPIEIGIAHKALRIIS